MFHEVEEPFGGFIMKTPQKNHMKNSGMGLSQMMTNSYVSAFTTDIHQKTSDYQKPMPQMGYYSHFATEEDSDFLGKMALQFYDSDKSGKIDAKACLRDIYKILGKTFGPSPQDIEDFSRHLDKNQDGRVTCDDFKKSAAQYLKAGHYMM